MPTTKQCKLLGLAVLGNRLCVDEIHQIKKLKGVIEIPIGIHDLESGYQGPTSLFLCGPIAKRWKVLQGKIFRMSVPISDTAQQTWYQLVKNRSHFEFELLKELNAQPINAYFE